MTFIYLTVILAGFWACKNTGMNMPCSADPCATDACRPQDCMGDSLWFGLDTFWSTEIEGTGLAMAQSKDIVVVSGFIGLNMFVKGFRKDSGEELWNWTDERFEAISTLHIHEESKRVILQDFSTVIALDLNSGEKIVDYKPVNYSSHFSYGFLEEDDYYYYCVREPDKSNYYVIRSLASDLQRWDIVFDIKNLGKPFESVILEAMNFVEGNLVFLGSLSGEYLGTYTISHDIKNDEINWYFRDSLSDATNFEQVDVYDQNVYYVTKGAIYCLDMQNGSSKWQNSFDQNAKWLSRFENTIYSQEGNVIWFYTDYIESDGGALCMDAETGEVIYDREFNAFDINTVHQHAGVMYFGSNRGVLYAVRTSDGQVLWDTEDQIGKYYVGCVVVDQEREVLYGFNGQELVAINIADD